MTRPAEFPRLTVLNTFFHIRESRGSLLNLLLCWQHPFVPSFVASYYLNELKLFTMSLGWVNILVVLTFLLAKSNFDVYLQKNWAGYFFLCSGII